MAGPVEAALLQTLGVNAPQDQQQQAPTISTDALGGVPRQFMSPPPSFVPAGTAAAQGGTVPGLGRGGKDWMNGVASRFGLTVSSGYRDPQHNAAVGGVPNSLHTQMDPYGQSRAYDFVGSPQAEQAALAWARQNGATEALIHNVGSGTHLHVGF